MKDKANWTIIMLISAENNLFPDMINVMEQLYSVPSNKEVKWIVIFDGIKADKFNNKFALPTVYEVKDGVHFILDFPVWPQDPDDNLVDKRYLGKLIKKIKKQFPAEQYGFIYKGHGGAGGTDISDSVFIERLVVLDPKVVEKDDNDEEIAAAIRKQLKLRYSYANLVKTTGFRNFKYSPLTANRQVYIALFTKRKTASSLSYKDIAHVLSLAFDEPLDFLLADCCWAQMIENAYTFRNITKNFIASADEMPAAGIGYDMFYRRLTTRPKINGPEISNMLASVFYYNKYDDYDDPQYNYMGVSITNAATDGIEEFTSKFEELCRYLKKNIGQYTPVIQKARSLCLDYTYMPQDPAYYAVYNIDLIWFLENLQFFNKEVIAIDMDLNVDKEITNLLCMLSNIRAVFLGSNYKVASPGQADAALGGKGICITFPANEEGFAKSVMVDDNSVRSDFFYKSGWLPLLRSYYKTLNTAKVATDVTDIPQSFVESFKSMHNKVDFTNINFITALNEATSESKTGETASKWGNLKDLFPE